MFRHSTPDHEDELSQRSHRPPEVDRTTQKALAQGRLDGVGPQGMAALQRAAGNRGVAGLVEDDADETVRSVLSSGGGRPLDDDTRSGMEAQLGADFSSVRVHTGSVAQRSAEAVNARAFTVGEDIVLGDGVDTSSADGSHTLAHELAHVVQQRHGPVDGVETDTGVRVSDPGDRFEQEAESTADAVMAGDGPGLDAEAAAAEPAEVQRQELEEEEELQMQRQEMPEEEEEELQMQRQAMGEEEEEDLQMQRRVAARR